MKKILFALAAAVMVIGAASCQKENFGNVKPVSAVENPLDEIKVVCAPDSKLALDDQHNVAFEVDDEIFGWDGNKKYTYKCTAVESGVATFARTSEDAPSAMEGTVINLVFAPGYSTSSIKDDNTLDIDLSSQGETLPIIMAGSGTTDLDGTCEVVFTNKISIVEVKDAVLPNAAENEEFSVMFGGKYNSLHFSLNQDGVLQVESAVSGPVNSTVKVKASADSKISARFAVPPAEEDDIVILASAADGSTYHFFTEKAIAPSKYITVANKEFTPQNVARIVEDGFTSLAKAVAAANAAEADVTITMLADISISSGVTVNNASGKTTTLDFAGHTVEYTGTGSNVITASTALVVEDATNEGGVNANICALRGNPGNLTINGGQYVGSGYADGGSGVVYASGGSVLTINGGIIKSVSPDNPGRAINVTQDSFIYGGTIICEGQGWALRQYTAGTCTVDGDNVVIYSKGTQSPVYAGSGTSIDFKNGYAYADGDMSVINDASRVAVTGGHFNKEFTAASGYDCVESTVTGPDGRTYTHTAQVSVKSVAEVTTGGQTTGYTTLESALTAALAADEATLKLLDDCTMSSAVTIENILTLDLNGKKLSQSGGNRLNVNNSDDAIFTITDSSPSASGIIENTSTGGYFVLVVTKGKCVLNAGTVQSTTAGQTIRVAGGVFEMNGGSVKNLGHSRKISGTSYAPAALNVRGGEANINGGLLYGQFKYAVSLGTAASKLNIHGGSFVADSLGAYPIYVTGDGLAHVTNIDNEKSEPLIVGYATSADHMGRAIYNGYKVSKIYTKAGLFTGTILGKVGSEDTHVAEGYKRVTGLSEKRTIDGTEYTFVMQVVKEEEN